MPLPAEKGLKHTYNLGVTSVGEGFDAPSSRKRIETWNACKGGGKNVLEDLMPLPAEKGLKRRCIGHAHKHCSWDLMPLPAEKGLKPKTVRGIMQDVARI